MEGESQRSIRILLVDDKPIICEGLSAVLSRQDDREVIAKADNGRNTIEQFRRFQTTLTLMDVSMPVIDGITATRAIMRESPAACILVVSSDPDAAAESLRAGTAAFQPKDSSRIEVVDVIHAVFTSMGKYSVSKTLVGFTPRLLA